MPQKKTVQNCRLCNSGRIYLLFKREDLYIFKCPDCRIVFLGNNLDERSIKNLYRYYSNSAFSDHISPVTEWRYKKLLDSFERYRKNNAIIDIGCGSGHFIQSAIEKGWDIDGTEISDEAIKIVSQKTNRVIKGDVASLTLEKEKYDIATLFELIEHAVDPEGIIKKLSYIIRLGGIVYMTTPNYNSITRRILGNRWGIFHKEHLFYFTPRALKQLLNKYGFKINNIKTRNLSLREILRIFKRSKSFEGPRIYEKQENLRTLAEENIFFSIFKKSVNFILNLFGAGETVYITAQKSRRLLD